MQNSRQLLAVGDDQGTVHVMDVPRNLRRMASNEKTFATSFFVREEQRVEWVGKRFEALVEQKEASKADAANEVPTGTEPAEGEPTEAEKLEAAFLQLEETFLVEMGLAPEAAPAAE